MVERPLLTVAISLSADVPDESALTIAVMAGRLGFSAVYLAAEPPDGLLERLSAAAAPALVVIDVPGEHPGIVRVNDPSAVREARAGVDASGSGRPVLVDVPISIGRTLGEAVARADLEPRFAGKRHPRLVGIFGAFEAAQDQVLALARAGADGVVLDVPLARDAADVLAQIRALFVGATAQLATRPLATERSVPPPRTVFYGQ